ncbi:MAG: hypothetical protein ABI151_00630, partial [Chitinophagaceae bacterium]
LFEPYRADFFRGDSFQVYVKDAKDALKLALTCRTLAIHLPTVEDEPLSDIRISVGIGEVISPITALATAKGEAFLLSGRSFDNMVKAGKRLQLSMTDPLANLTLELMSDYLNSIYAGITTKQAEVILELLKGRTQQEIAEKLSRSKSTVNQHVSSGRWEEIERLMWQYERLLIISAEK